MTQQRTLADELREQFQSSPGRLLARFWGLVLLLFLLVAFVLLLAAPWMPEDEPPTIELKYLAPGLQVEANFAPALLHSGLVFALLWILIGIYRLTKTRYIAYWAGAMGSFFLLYLYMLLRIYFIAAPGAPKGPIPLPRWDLYWTELFSFGSTILVLLSGLELLSLKLSRKQQLFLVVTVIGALAVAHSIGAFLLFIPLASRSLLPGGVLSLATVWIAGYGVFDRMKALPGQEKIGRGFLLFFLLYGLLQPLILFINTQPHHVFVTTGAYFLKALCTGFIIFLVLNETWQEKEEQLKEVEKGKDDLARVLNENNLGYFRADRDGVIKEANKAEASLLGYKTPEEIKTQKTTRLAMMEDQNEREVLLNGLTKNGIVWNYPNRIRTVNQEIVHLRTNFQALKSGDDGELTGFEGIDRDVTAEALLEQEKERQRILIERVNEALSTSSSVGELFAAVLEIVAEQASAHSAALLLVGDETEIPATLFIVQSLSPQKTEDIGRVFQLPKENEDDLTGAEPSAFGTQIAQTLFGTEAEDETTIQIPMLRLEKQYGLALLRIERLGDLEERQDALRQTLARVAFNYLHVHRSELQALRQKIRELLSQPGDLDAQMQGVVQLLREELRADEVRLALQLWREGGIMLFPRQGESPSVLPLGKDLPGEARQAWLCGDKDITVGASRLVEATVPIFDRFHRPFGYLLVRNPRPHGSRVSALSVVDREKLVDISEAIGVVAEMWVSVYNMTKLLETTTHEFRSPAVAIRNTVDVLRKNLSSYQPERIQRKLTDIMLDSSLLIGLTNNLDTLQGRPIGKQVKSVSIFQDIIFKTIRQLRPLAQRLTYEHEGAHRFPIIHVVEEDLLQILFNLIHNAVKYAKLESTVQVKFIGGQEGEMLTLKVQDWGIGVPAGYEQKVFEREVRAPNALKSNVNGMGMGLAVSLDLARQMGGDLRVTRLQDPTELTLYIPKKLQVPQEVTQ